MQGVHRYWLALLGMPCLLSACPVDDRALSENEASSGSADLAVGSSAGAAANVTGGAGGSNPAGAAGGLTDGGNAGEAGEPNSGGPALVNGCADLDNDGVSDCTETLLDNAEFDKNVTLWTAEPDASLSWDARDLLGGAGSGSALVTSFTVSDSVGDSFVAAEQCVSVRAGAILTVSASAYIDASAVTGRAAISLWFFQSDACAGDTAAEVYKTPEQFASSKLITLQGTALVPELVQSVRVRLGVIKPFKADPFAVHFDNVLLRVR
jgi:hypothetical protein